MAFTHQTAVITNASSRYGMWSVQALARTVRSIVAVVKPGAACDSLRVFSNVEIVEADLSQEAAWQSLHARFASRAGGVDVLLHAAAQSTHPAAIEEGIRANIIEPWLVAKYACHLMRDSGRGVVLLQAMRPSAAGGDAPLFEGEWQSVRVASAAALLDAAKHGTRLRLNRLVFDALVREADFKAAVRMLTDERSSFMTGAEIQLEAIDRAIDARDDLADKTVLVTGATSGIGRATAIELGRLGAWVAVGGRKLPLAEQTLSRVRAAGGDGIVVPLDVTREQDWRSAVDTIVATRGALDGLVSNAGESRNRHIAETPVDDLDFLLSVNYRACLFGMRHASEAMRRSRGGSIVNVTSVAGLRAGPGNAAYGASKAGAIGLTCGFAASMTHMLPRVRINALQPGFIWSDSVVDALGPEGAASFRAMIEPKTPLGRVGEVDEVARVAAFLLSDAAEAINGQAINVSGGLELAFP